jgi:hypothetical protein
MFDRIVVVTIPAAVERQKNISERLAGIDFSFHLGRDTRDASVSELPYSLEKRTALRKPPMTPAEIGCAWSHREVLESVKPDERVLILEDDVKIVKPLRMSPHDWSLCYYGYHLVYPKMPLSVRVKTWTYYPLTGQRNVSRIYAKPIDEYWMTAGWFNGAHAYAVDYQAAQWIVRENTPISQEADFVLQRLVRFSNLRCIAEREPTFIADFSDGSLIGDRLSWH